MHGYILTHRHRPGSQTRMMNRCVRREIKSMKFCEKVKRLRRDLKLTQAELAAKIGVSGRSVASYEAGTSNPRYQKTYDMLAAALGVDVNYLRTEDEELPEDAGCRFGSCDCRRAQVILTEARQLFDSPDLSYEDKLAFLTEMMRLFLNSRHKTLL